MSLVTTSSTSHRVTIAVAVILAVAAGVVATTSRMLSPADTAASIPAAPATFSPTDAAEVDHDIAGCELSDFVPDVERLAYARTTGVFLTRSNGAETSTCQLAEARDAFGLTWSGDGRWLGYLTDGQGATADRLVVESEITIIDMTSGQRVLADLDLRGSVSPRPGGFAVLDGGTLLLFDLNDGRVDQLSVRGVPLIPPYVDWDPQFLLTAGRYASVRLVASTLTGDGVLLRAIRPGAHGGSDGLSVVGDDGERAITEFGGSRPSKVGEPDPSTGVIPLVRTQTCGNACADGSWVVLVDPADGANKPVPDQPALPVGRFWTLSATFGRNGQLIISRRELSPVTSLDARPPGEPELVVLDGDSWRELGQVATWGSTSPGGVLAVIRSEAGPLEIIGPDGAATPVSDGVTEASWAP